MRSRNILALVSCLAFAAPVLGAQQAAAKSPTATAMAKDSGKKTAHAKRGSKKAAAMTNDSTAKTAKAKATPKK